MNLLLLSILESDLDFLRASSKNSQRENGRRVGNATVKAIEYLHRNKMYIVGGLIVGNPDDTRESVQENRAFWRISSEASFPSGLCVSFFLVLFLSFVLSKVFHSDCSLQDAL